jgi:hypothetical protein
MKRKSGDRPDANPGLFNFDGRVEEYDHAISAEDRVAALEKFPNFLAFCLTPE